MNTEQKQNVPEPVRNGLAVVGFVTLIVCGMALAVYGARFVPAAVGNLSGAAVSLISVFIPNEEPVVPVIVEVPAVATTTQAVATSTTTTTTPVPAGQETVTVFPVGTAPITELYGSPDLSVSTLTVGYLKPSNKAFVDSKEVPEDAYRVVVKFIVKNEGTNVVEEGWRINANFPSRASKTIPSNKQPRMLPGDRIEYTLQFERPIVGKNQEITITADADKDTNSANDTATALINVND